MSSFFYFFFMKASLREACQKKKLQILRHCLKDGGEGSSQTPIRKKNLIETQNQRGGGVWQILKCLIYLLLKFHQIYISYLWRIFTKFVSILVILWGDHWNFWVKLSKMGDFWESGQFSLYLKKYYVSIAMTGGRGQ